MSDANHNQFWLDKWKHKKIGFHELEPHNLLTQFWSHLKVPNTSKVLVPLCGKSIDMMWLKRSGHHVSGIELSEAAITSFFDENRIDAEIQYGDKNNCYVAENLTIWEADIFNLPNIEFGSYKVIYDRAALVAVNPCQRHRYVNSLADNMPSGSYMFLIGLEYEKSVLFGPPFSLAKSDIELLYGESWKIKEIERQATMIKDQPGLEVLYILERV
jgi:thiopurine S-methyltransferase